MSSGFTVDPVGAEDGEGAVSVGAVSVGAASSDGSGSMPGVASESFTIAIGVTTGAAGGSVCSSTFADAPIAATRAMAAAALAPMTKMFTTPR